MRRLLQASCVLVLGAAPALQRATDERASSLQSLEAKCESDAAVAKQIRGFAGGGYQLTTVDLCIEPAHFQRARAEFDQKRGPNFVYTTRLADGKPAWDWRK